MRLLSDLPDSLPDMSRQPAGLIMQISDDLPRFKRPEPWDDYNRQLAQLNEEVSGNRSSLLIWLGCAAVVALIAYLIDPASLWERTGLWPGVGQFLGFVVIVVGGWPGLLGAYACLERVGKRADLRQRREDWHARVAWYYANYQSWIDFDQRREVIAEERRRRHQTKVDANKQAWEAHCLPYRQNAALLKARQARLAEMEQQLIAGFSTFAVQEDFDGSLPRDELMRRYRPALLSFGEEAGLLRLSKNPQIYPMVGDGAFLPPAPPPPIEPPAYVPPHPDLKTPSFHAEACDYTEG